MMMMLSVVLIVWCVTAVVALGYVKQQIHTVYLASMNHFDAGFNHGEKAISEKQVVACLFPPYPPECGYAYSVINVYFDVFFPQGQGDKSHLTLLAIATAQELRKRGGVERLVYTTQPWLLSLYFDCPPHLFGEIHCPNATARQAMETAIRLGDIAWHAIPFNLQRLSNNVSNQHMLVN